MARRESLGEQFRATIGAATLLVSSKTMRELLHKAAREICASVRESSADGRSRTSSSSHIAPYRRSASVIISSAPAR